MLRTLGCDAVGMSTVVEAIAANHMGMRICGISCISNLAAGMTDQPLNHEEVQEAADMAAPRFKKRHWSARHWKPENWHMLLIPVIRWERHY